MFDLSPAQVKLALEGFQIHAARPDQQQVLDLRTADEGDLAERLGIDRDLPPADSGDSTLVGYFGNQSLDNFDHLAVFRRKKEDSNRHILIVFNEIAEFFRCFSEKREGDLGQHSRPIPGLHISVDRPAVGHAADRSQSVVEDGERTLTF